MDHLTLAQLLGNYGEFVGAIAVVVTLAYLAVQVRHSRAATEAHTKMLASTALRDMEGRMENRFLLLATNSEFAERARRLYQDPDALSELEYYQLSFWVVSWVADLEEAYRQFDLGTIP